MAEGAPVDRHVSGCVHGIELDVCHLVNGIKALGRTEGPAVATGSAPVVVASVLAVLRVPGVRNVDLGYVSLWSAEAPALIEALVSAHASSHLHYAATP